MRTLVEAYLAAYNRFDIDAMMALMDPSVVFEHYQDGALSVRTEGREALEQLARGSAAAFSSRRQTLLDYHGDAFVGTASIRFEAVPAIDLPGGPGAGRPLVLEGRSDFHFREHGILYLADFSRTEAVMPA